MLPTIHEAPWNCFDASNIETKLNRNGRLVFDFKEENATPINAINNKTPTFSQLSIKQLAKNFDDLTGNSFAESTLTYSQKDRHDHIDFKILDIKKEDRRLIIKSDIMEHIDELPIIHDSKPCTSTEVQCEPDHVLEQATFTIHLPLIPGVE